MLYPWNRVALVPLVRKLSHGNPRSWREATSGPQNRPEDPNIMTGTHPCRTMVTCVIHSVYMRPGLASLRMDRAVLETDIMPTPQPVPCQPTDQEAETGATEKQL